LKEIRKTLKTREKEDKSMKKISNMLKRETEIIESPKGIELPKDPAELRMY